MRSFAVWYDRKGNDNKDDTDNKNNIEADIHVNFWSQLNYEGEEDICFFDFGVKIHDLTNVANINIYCPFPLRKEDVKDLGGRISNNSLINAIFNEDYSVTDGIPKHFIVQDKSFTEIKKDSEKGNDVKGTRFIVYELNDSNEIKIEACCRETSKPDISTKARLSNGTIIEIHTADLLEHATGLAKNIKEYYFRIRVKTNKNALGFLTKKAESINVFKQYLETIELMDFRINDIRSCCNEVRDRFNIGGKFKVQSIHFLVMRKVDQRVTADGHSYNCRLLEKDIWNNYIDNLSDDFIAYHFKEKCKGNADNVDNLVVLLQFRYRNSTKIVMFVYLSAAILLSVIANIIYDYLKYLKGVINHGC